MDFVIGEELTALRKRVRSFVDERVIPVEQDVIREDQATADSATLKRLRRQRPWPRSKLPKQSTVSW